MTAPTTPAAPRRKLIEVSLPLEAINRESAREKEPFTRKHPRSLHIWFARRPLVAVRAVLFAQLVDDPSCDPRALAIEDDRGGRLVVVSFHSLEDRMVKRFMLGAAGRTPAPSRHDPRSLMDPLGAPLLRNRAAPDFRLLTNGAERPGPHEARANPRARSARLRALARLAATQDRETAPA